LKFTLKQIAEYFDVDTRTIERYLDTHGDELKKNGYEIRTGKHLTEAKSTLGSDINVGTKTTIL
jgi:transcriptional antiterminator